MDIHPENVKAVDEVDGVISLLELCFARHFYKIRTQDEVFIEGHPLNPEGICANSDPALPGAIFRYNYAVYPPVLFLGVEKDAHTYMKRSMSEFIGALNADLDPDVVFGDSRRDKKIQPLTQARIELTPENLEKIAEFIGFQSSFHLAEDEIAALASCNPKLGAIAAEKAIFSIKAAMRTPEAEAALDRLLSPHARRILAERNVDQDRIR